VSDTPLVRRNVHSRVVDALADTRIVVIQGARQVGKSTLAAQILEERGGTAVTLDDPESFAFATADPTGFIAQGGDRMLVIDELQRAPELVIALKAAADRDQRPGRFLVTGSANLLDLAATHESLAGRAERVELYPLSQRELAGRDDSVIDALFAGTVSMVRPTGLHRSDYLEIACSGGYPEALRRRTATRRDDWYTAYVSQIVRRDAVDISGLQRLADLPRLLRLIAARMGTTMVWASLATDAGIPRRTLDPYVALLDTLYLTHTIPAWAVNLTTREVKQPKVFPVDSGLAASLLGLTSATLGPTSPLAGPLLECFVAGELRRQLGWAKQRASLFHYRDSRGVEVDFVLEAPDGRVVAVEVKAAATVTAKDASGIGVLRDRLGDRFAGGYVFYTGDRSIHVADRVTAVPLEAVWQAPAG